MLVLPVHLRTFLLGLFPHPVMLCTPRAATQVWHVLLSVPSESERRSSHS